MFFKFVFAQKDEDYMKVRIFKIVFQKLNLIEALKFKNELHVAM